MHPANTPPIQEVCFIACHPGAGAHFAEFAYRLAETDICWTALATENAYTKFAARGISAINFYSQAEEVPLIDLPPEQEERLVEEVLTICRISQVVMVDVGHPFIEKVLERLKKETPQVKRIAYVDNPEPLISGECSEVAQRIMKLAHGILYANPHLVKGPRDMGLGYYPLPQGRQPLAVFVGAANREYMDTALPAFLKMLSEASQKEDLSHMTLLYQQHPRAASEYHNRDRQQIEQWMDTAPEGSPQVSFSQRSLSEALKEAHVVLYYQTSESPSFILAGIPTIQVGSRYEDIPVRYGLCPSVQSADDFLKALATSTIDPDKQRAALKAVGYSSDWFPTLYDLIKKRFAIQP